MRSNLLSGGIPESLGNLRQLQYLYAVVDVSRHRWLTRVETVTGIFTTTS
jgi:hypothetical protein